LGAWTSPNTGFTVDQREAQLGRRYRIVHRYHGWGEVFPEPSEVNWAQGGRTLYLAWDARVFSTNTPVSWASIANGSQDAVIDAQADRIRAFGRPLFMDFSQEPEAEVDDGRYGTVADFAAAYRHIVQRFRARGATNVSWVWSVMGYSGYYSYYTGGLYPGDDVIDWIGWDPYNWYLCHGSAWKSFAEKVSGFYGWLNANGHADKPFMLSEFGSRENDLDPLAKGQWFRDALATLKAGTFPKLKALVYFDSNRAHECDWRIDTSPASLAGFRRLGSDPYLNPRG
jgi:beta-mannanase